MLNREQDGFLVERVSKQREEKEEEEGRGEERSHGEIQRECEGDEWYKNGE